MSEFFDEMEMDVTLDEASDDDGFELALEGSHCSNNNNVNEGDDDMDDDYEPDDDDVMDVEESMLDDAYDVYSTVCEADDASVENIDAYEKLQSCLSYKLKPLLFKASSIYASKFSVKSFKTLLNSSSVR